LFGMPQTPAATSVALACAPSRRDGRSALQMLSHLFG